MNEDLSAKTRQNEDIEYLKDKVSSLELQLKDKDREIRYLREIVRQRESSVSWRLSQLYGKFFSMGSPVTKALSRVFEKAMPMEKQASLKKSDDYKNELERILRARKGKVKGIIIYPPTVDWNIPLFQRPQQLALELSKNGYLFFYSTCKNEFDRVDGFYEINENCYITNQYDLLVRELSGFIVILSSTNLDIRLEEVIKIKERATIVYDYIDEIHTDIIARESVAHISRRHEYMRKRADIFIATADNLYNEALKYREKDTYLIPNGVDYEHFHIARNIARIPADFVSIIEKNKPIIGYYGAMAKWLDYELIKKAAAARPNYEFVLIGWDYDGSIVDQGLEQFENIHFLGAKDYSILPQYAVWFDVSTIPFILNSITESTSPIKVFEYMALSTPILTTDLRECRKYGSVLIANGREDFIGKLDDAIKLKDDNSYLALLDKEAKENTWDKRAIEIINCIEAKHL